MRRTSKAETITGLHQWLRRHGIDYARLLHDNLKDGREYTAEEVSFMMAAQAEKERLGKSSLTTAEILRMAVRLGYRKRKRRGR